MDVGNSSSSGMTPLRRRRLLARLPAGASEGGAAGSRATLPFAFGGSRQAHGTASAGPMVRGSSDGPDIVLPTGVRIRRTIIAGMRVNWAEVMQAVQGVQALPVAHQQLMARTGAVIELVPVAGLELTAGGQPMLGATTIDRAPMSDTWRASLVRVAVRSPRSVPGTRESIGEIVQHEIGHVLAVLSGQDRGEDAAERYARTY